MIPSPESISAATLWLILVFILLSFQGHRLAHLLAILIHYFEYIGRNMPPRPCALCEKAKAMVKRPKTGQQICRDCFFYVFETEVHNTITDAQLFKPGDRVAIGASGGKGELTGISLVFVSKS
jgi:hypothetical protein